MLYLFDILHTYERSYLDKCLALFDQLQWLPIYVLIDSQCEHDLFEIDSIIRSSKADRYLVFFFNIIEKYR